MFKELRRLVKDSNNYKWVMLALFWLLYFSFGMIRAAISPLIAPIAEELQLSNSQLGTILGVFMIAYIFLSIPIGIIIDKIGIKKSILIGSLLLTLSGILRSFATNYITMLFSVGLMGLGCPTISVGVPKGVLTWFTGKDKDTATGIYVTGMTIGIATATAITTSIIQPIIGNWRNTLLVYGIFSLLITVAWFLFSKEPQSKKTERIEKEESSESTTDSLFRLLRNKQVMLLLAIGFFYMFISYGMGGWLPRLLELKEIDSTRVGLIASLPSWFGLVGSILLTNLARKVKRKYVMFSAFFLLGISIYLIGAGVGVTLIAALVIYGIVSMGVTPLMIVSFMDIPEVGVEFMGIATGLWFSIGAIGGFLGPTIIGYLLDITGSYFTGILVMAGVAEAMTIVIQLLKH